MTKPVTTEPEAGEARGCAWCGGPLDRPATTGRPKTYCRRSCRQRAYEARRRLTDDRQLEELVRALRDDRDELSDRLWVLLAGLADTRRLADDEGGPVAEAIGRLLNDGGPPPDSPG